MNDAVSAMWRNFNFDRHRARVHIGWNQVWLCPAIFAGTIRLHWLYSATQRCLCYWLLERLVSAPLSHTHTHLGNIIGSVDCGATV